MRDGRKKRGKGGDGTIVSLLFSRAFLTEIFVILFGLLQTEHASKSDETKRFYRRNFSVKLVPFIG